MPFRLGIFYSHVNYSVTKIAYRRNKLGLDFYSHVNYSVTKMRTYTVKAGDSFYSHVNYSVTKIDSLPDNPSFSFTVT